MVTIMEHPSSALRFTVVVPCFNEADSIPELLIRIKAAFVSIGAHDQFEVLFINDGSTDDTESIIKSRASTEDFVGLISLRRNCGKSLALMTGFRAAKGDFIITMDSDLQDRPEDIPKLVAKIEEGFDVVSGWRQKRQDTQTRSVGSRIFNYASRAASGLDLHDFNSGFKIYRKRVLDEIVVFGQYHRYIPLIAHLAGFKVGETLIGNDARKYGSSKFVTFRYEGLFDLVSILFTHRYGLSPLHFFGTLAAILIIPSALVIGYFFISQALYWMGAGSAFMVGTRPLLLLSLFTFLSGILVLVPGFICDFILHHQISSRIESIIGLSKSLEISSVVSSRHLHEPVVGTTLNDGAMK
jgi:glycosyltransferase involved in cell wall biosynthesis